MPTRDRYDLHLCEPAAGDLILSARGRRLGRIGEVWQRIYAERFFVSSDTGAALRVEPGDAPGVWIEALPAAAHQA